MVERAGEMENKINELVEKLKGAAAGNLKAVVLYGSSVTGEFSAGHSKINILCIVNDAGAAKIEALHSPAEWWVGQGHPAPLIFTMEELRRSADIFAIELLDIQAHHKMLFGEDFLAGLSVPARLHRLQVERELRTNWLRLRETILIAPRKANVLLDVMRASFSSFATLFRHALIALGEKPAESKREGIDRVAQLTNADPVGFHVILNLREGKRKEKDIDVEDTLRRYCEMVEAVTDLVDKRLDAQS